MEITYEAIKPILVEEAIEGTNITCRFEVEGESFESKGTVRIDSKDSSNRIKGMVKMTLISRMRTTFNRVLRSVLGGGVQASLGQQVSNAVIMDKTKGGNFSAKDKERGVVDAFNKISFNFYIDPETKKWKIARLLSEFEKQLKAKPITKAYDKKALARMLIEMAKADGKIEPQEKEFFQDFLNEDTGSFSELMRTPSLSKVECEEISQDAKPNIFMVTAAVAISDHDFDDAERQRLEEYAEMLGFDDNMKSKALKMAQDYTIETFIHAGGNISREEIYEFADRIGMDRSEAERAQIRLTKRMDG